MAIGKITQVIGSTFDCEFPESELPQIYNAVECTISTRDGDKRLVGEVQQQGPLRRAGLDRRTPPRHGMRR